MVYVADLYLFVSYLSALILITNPTFAAISLPLQGVKIKYYEHEHIQDSLLS